MAKAIETPATTAKLHNCLGMTTRASGLVAVCSTNDPVGRKRHVTGRSVGETKVFYMDVEIGMVAQAELIAAVMRDALALDVWQDLAEAQGYTREEALAALQKAHAGTAKAAPSLSELKAAKLAAQEG